jgi:hypothetical protein
MKRVRIAHRHRLGKSKMQYSPLVKRIAGDGADAWIIHYEARAAHERGEDVIC